MIEQVQVACEEEMVFELAEPDAIRRKRANSASPSLPQPSAMFAGTEAHERLIWLVNPYSSSRGNLAVAS
jgi:hypothetical protein